MKVLIISSHFPNTKGGVSDYTFHLSKALSKRNLKVYVLTSDYSEVLQTVDDIYVIPTIKSWNILGVNEIIQEIRRVGPDIILIQYVPYMYDKYGLPIYFAFLCIILKLFFISKIIVNFHEIARSIEFRNPKFLIIALIQRLIAYIICVCCDRVIVSIEVYRNILGFFDKKIKIIPIGSNIIPIEISKHKRNEIRREYAAKNEFIICTFGSRPRNTDILIRVVKKINREGINLKLLIIGGLKDKHIKKLNNLADDLNCKDNVIITGYLPSEDVYKLLTISDLFILLGNIDKKGLGGVSIKNTSISAAYAAGLPILATKGFMTDNFFDNKNIIFIKSLSEDVICNRIKYLFSNNEMLIKLRTNSIETYKSKLAWDVIAKKYHEVIQEIRYMSTNTS